MFPPSQPHPQFVAAKSLMFNLPKYLLTLNNMSHGMSCLQNILNSNKFRHILKYKLRVGLEYLPEILEMIEFHKFLQVYK